MAFVNLDSVHHFQPPRSTRSPLQERSEGHSTAWKRRASTVRSEHDGSLALVLKTKTGANLENCEPAGYIDLIHPLPIETGGDPFGEPALSLRGTETVQCKALFAVDGRSMTTSRFSLGCVPSQGGSGGERRPLPVRRGAAARYWRNTGATGDECRL